MVSFVQEQGELVVNGYVDKALKNMLEKYGDNYPLMYSTWVQIRGYIFRDETNRSPAYYDEMGDLMDMVKDPDDQAKMMTVTYGTLQLQHRLHSMKRTYLKNKEANAVFKEIRPIVADFYDFVLPPEVHKEFKETSIARRVAKQETGHGKVSIRDAERFLKNALEQLDKSEWNTWEHVVALAFVSGRRQSEIVFSMTWNAGPTEYQAMVDGIMKTNSIKDMAIPLLCHYDIFDRCMKAIRERPEVIELNEMDDELLAMKRLGSRIRYYSERMYGRVLTHTVRRNIYVDLTYRRRSSQNHFMENSSKPYFAQKVLGHTVTDIMPSQIYQAFNLDDE